MCCNYHIVVNHWKLIRIYPVEGKINFQFLLSDWKKGVATESVEIIWDESMLELESVVTKVIDPGWLHNVPFC